MNKTWQQEISGPREEKVSLVVLSKVRLKKMELTQWNNTENGTVKKMEHTPENFFQGWFAAEGRQREQSCRSSENKKEKEEV